MKTEHRVFGAAVDNDALRNQEKPRPSYVSVISRDAINFGSQFMTSAPRKQRSSGVHSPTAVAAAGENRDRGGIEALHAVKPQSVSGIIVSPSARPKATLIKVNHTC